MLSQYNMAPTYTELVEVTFIIYSIKFTLRLFSLNLQLFSESS